MKPTVVMVDPQVLTPHPDRTKAGTVLTEADGKYQFIRATIVEHGIEDPLKVQTGTNIIIGGHTRHRIALELGLPEVPVTYYDVDDETARYMMVVDNHKRIGDEQDAMKLAWTFKVVVEKEGFKHGGNRRGISSSPEDNLKPKSLSEIASFFDLKQAHFIRYLDLLRLIPALQRLVSEQKIGVKAGSILAHLSPENQQKVFQSITPEAFDPDYRLTENEAKSFADAFKSDSTVPAYGDSEDDNDEMAELNRIFAGANGDNESAIEPDAVDEDSSQSAGWKVELNDDGGYIIHGYDGRDRDTAVENLHADAVLDEPEHKKYLDQAKKVDDAHAIATRMADEIYNSTRDVTRMMMRMDDEESRLKFAQNQLETSIKKQLAWIRRIDLEVVPLRALVGDELNESNRELWNELTTQLTRLAEKLQALAEV
ncbi:MAG: ParB N-terminal domain-containing protein [Alicyclobacillus sp.]|nr:ParB N-terminal domain-containing protein [Alicyclobacillus sp.]